MLLARIEDCLKEAVFALRPDYRTDAMANVLFTMTICGGFYAFDQCRHLGEEAVLAAIAALNRKVVELLPQPMRPE